MDPMSRVRDYLLDNVGHRTYPGQASFNAAVQRWFVPIYCRTERGAVVVGDVEVDLQGHILFAPSREEMLSRLSTTGTPTSCWLRFTRPLADSGMPWRCSIVPSSAHRPPSLRRMAQPEGEQTH